MFHEKIFEKQNASYQICKKWKKKKKKKSLKWNDSAEKMEYPIKNCIFLLFNGIFYLFKIAIPF